MSYAGTASNLANDQKAARILKQLSNQPLQPSLLVHCFSNGGGLKLTNLARLIRQEGSTTPALRPSAIIYDSVPGKVGFKTFFRAFAIPFQNRSFLIRYPAFFAIAFTYLLGTVYKLVTRREDRVTVMRKDFLDPLLFSTASKRIFVSFTFFFLS